MTDQRDEGAAVTRREPNTLVERNVAPIIIDDPILGELPETDVKLVYADGSQDTLRTNDKGHVVVSLDRGRYVDIEFVTELREHKERVFVVLDPVSTPAGAWQRLVNLGYHDQEDPSLEPADPDDLALALAEFQSEHGVDPTGSLDEQTQSLLESGFESSTPWGERDLAPAPEPEEAGWGTAAKDEWT